MNQLWGEMVAVATVLFGIRVWIRCLLIEIFILIDFWSHERTAKMWTSRYLVLHCVFDAHFAVHSALFRVESVMCWLCSRFNIFCCHWIMLKQGCESHTAILMLFSKWKTGDCLTTASSLWKRLLARREIINATEFKPGLLTECSSQNGDSPKRATRHD